MESESYCTAVPIAVAILCIPGRCSPTATVAPSAPTSTAPSTTSGLSSFATAVAHSRRESGRLGRRAQRIATRPLTPIGVSCPRLPRACESATYAVATHRSLAPATQPHTQEEQAALSLWKWWLPTGQWVATLTVGRRQRRARPPLRPPTWEKPIRSAGHGRCGVSRGEGYQSLEQTARRRAHVGAPQTGDTVAFTSPPRQGCLLDKFSFFVRYTGMDALSRQHETADGAARGERSKEPRTTAAIIHNGRPAKPSPAGIVARWCASSRRELRARSTFASAGPMTTQSWWHLVGPRVHGTHANRARLLRMNLFCRGVH